jgi:hypothetical protein
MLSLGESALGPGAKLIDRPVELVNQNGAPQGEKHIAIFNPPVVNQALGIRRSALKAAEAITLRLVRQGAQTITFAPSRMTVERLVHELRKQMKTRPGEPDVVEGYRIPLYRLRKRKGEEIPFEAGFCYHADSGRMVICRFDSGFRAMLPVAAVRAHYADPEANKPTRIAAAADELEPTPAEASA